MWCHLVAYGRSDCWYCQRGTTWNTLAWGWCDTVHSRLQAQWNWGRVSQWWGTWSSNDQILDPQRSIRVMEKNYRATWSHRETWSCYYTLSLQWGADWYVGSTTIHLMYPKYCYMYLHVYTCMLVNVHVHTMYNRTNIFAQPSYIVPSFTSQKYWVE